MTSSRARVRAALALSALLAVVAAFVSAGAWQVVRTDVARAATVTTNITAEVLTAAPSLALPDAHLAARPSAAPVRAAVPWLLALAVVLACAAPLALWSARRRSRGERGGFARTPAQPRGPPGVAEHCPATAGPAALTA